MTRACVVLLLAGAAAAADFEIEPPPASDDWERKAIPAGSTWLKAHLQLHGPGDRPPVARVDVKVYEAAAEPDRPLPAVLAAWRDSFERNIADPKGRAETEGRLGGEPCHEVNVTGHDGRLRLTWCALRRGAKLYVLEIRRTYAYADDPDVGKEIAAIRASFRFVGKPGPPPGAEKPPAAPPPPPARTLKEEFWRFSCLKPEGFRVVAEKGPVLRMEARRRQATCVVRVYASSLPSRWRLKDLVRQRRDAFAADPSFRRREDPVERTWRPPLARRGAVELVLRGLKASPVESRWFLADCRNDRRYEIQVYVTGRAADWKTAVDAFLASFRPVRR